MRTVRLDVNNYMSKLENKIKKDGRTKTMKECHSFRSFIDSTVKENDISYEIREMFDLMPVLHPRGDHDGNIVVLKYNEQDLVLTLFAETNNNKYQPT